MIMPLYRVVSIEVDPGASSDLMTRHVTSAVHLLLALCLATATACAAQPRQPELLLVYWSSADCRWCAYWESARSGLEQELKDSPEFKKITYRVIKNERLADPYRREHFPPDTLWLYERVQRGEEARPGRPSWILYADRKRIAGFYGTTQWEEKHFPEIKRLIHVYRGEQ